jgi:hypothetical protein
MRTVDQVGSFLARYKVWIIAAGMGLLPGCTPALHRLIPSLF